MDDDIIQTETESQRLTHNRNNNFVNQPIIIDSLRLQRIFNTTNIFKYFSLLIMVFLMFCVISLNQVHNVDYRKFNYTKSNLLQIYLNSILDTMKTTFNDKVYFNDDFITNSNELDHNDNKALYSNEELKDNLNKKELIKEINKQSLDYTKQESQNTIKSRHLTFKNYKIDQDNLERNNSDKDFLKAEDIKNSNDEKNSLKLFLKNEKTTVKLNQQKEIILPDQNSNENYKNNIEISTNNNDIKYASQRFDSKNQTLNNSKNSNLTNNNTFSNATNASEKITETEKIDFKLGEVYYFMNNITQYEYSGRWKGCNPNNMFEQSEGEMSMQIRKNQSHQVFNVIPNIEFFRILEFTFNAKDGDYRDNWMVFNFTMKFPKNFHKNFITKDQQIKENNRTNETFNIRHLNDENTIKDSVAIDNKITLIEENIQIKYYIAELFETKNITQCNNSKVELEFVRAPIFKVENFDEINSIEFSKINGKISDPDCQFKFDFSLQIETEEDYSSRVWNYSLIITAISIAEIYLTYKLVIEISNNYQKGKNVRLYIFILFSSV